MKRARQGKILELINRYEIETQEDLAKRLLEAGIPVTQATVSRDIRELSLTKVAGGNGRPKYASTDYGGGKTVFTDRYARVLQDGMIEINPADNLVVIKTVSCRRGRAGHGGDSRLDCRRRHDYVCGKICFHGSAGD